MNFSHQPNPAFLMEMVGERDERAYWRRLIEELQAWRVTLEMIASELEVSDRQVSNWKTGDRPKGMTAIKLYLFHDKHRTRVHGAGER